MSKQTLEISPALNFKDFFSAVSIESSKDLLDETTFGQWKEQIVPSIYIRQNEFFRLNFNAAERGMNLKLISTKKNIIFCLEFPDTIFLRDYDPSDSKFSVLLKIERNSISRYQNNGKIHFMALKAKKSYEMMQRVPVRGLLTGLMVRGAMKLAAKAEDDLIEKEGNQFSLFYYENGIEKQISIIVDAFYVDNFDTLLKKNWSQLAPKKEDLEEPKGSGCFIATACYGDYAHPMVIQLRSFRDHYLKYHKWGREFISLYYKKSPTIASKIEKLNLLKIMVRIFIITPLIFLSRILLPKYYTNLKMIRTQLNKENHAN